MLDPTVVNCGVIPKPDSDSDFDGVGVEKRKFVGVGVGVVKKRLFGVGVGVTKKKFSESVSESHERKIYMNKYHKMKYMY
jgi:hypothetical protein